MHESDPNIVTSSLSGFVTKQGVTVRVNIIRWKMSRAGRLRSKTSMGRLQSETTCSRLMMPRMRLSVRPSMKNVCAPSSTKMSSYPSDVSTVSVRRSFGPSVRKLHFRGVTPNCPAVSLNLPNWERPMAQSAVDHHAMITSAVQGFEYIERLWHSVKHQRIYLHAYALVPEGRAASAATWLSTTSSGRTPRLVVGRLTSYNSNSRFSQRHN